MIRYDKGDVVLVKFPYTDLSTIKKRPSLVISASWYNRTRCDVIVLPISSKLSSSPRRDDYVLSKEDVRLSGLLKDSVVKLGKIMTLEKGFVLRKLGHLPEDTFRKIMRMINDVLG